ncbi:MAG: BsuBI/PstI family type II restriction endonuclease [Acidiferrobacter thiooxydans]
MSCGLWRPASWAIPPDRRTFNTYQEVVSWESEVWIADHQSHLIRFNGVRFLRPYRAGYGHDNRIAQIGEDSYEY